MRKTLVTVAALTIPAHIMGSATSPAVAISVELAKKCRDMAIKAHPPPSSLGGKAYAQAERSFFSECVSRNGQMPEAGAQKREPNSNPPPH
jgi:hypothetical protein